ncbi:Relaxase/mobilization nuclease domain protein (fragment) [Paraburkholderia ribeironis]|uniref:Relaxase/mobilization nuclease domain protein n=1 Tax=Paraburkholderia ribeironis TaxID=1247936 RepID=A0A1N7S4Y6_9BURK
MQKKRGTSPERRQVTPAQDARHIHSGNRSETGQKVRCAYGAMAKAMSKSEDVEDRKIAVEIVNLVKQMPSVQHAFTPLEPDRPAKSALPRPDVLKRAGREPNGGPSEPSRRKHAR